MSKSNKPAVLVEMNISVWTAQRVDRAATEKATNDAHALADAGKFRKNLTAGTTLRKDIADYAALCRTWHSGKTMPWSDKGVRLLPMSMFMDYKAEANSRRAYFENKVEKFLEEYPTLLSMAPQRLGALFDPSEYPTPEQVREKFSFRLVFSPIPEAGDFRFDVGNEELAELQAQWQEAADQRFGDAMQSASDKLLDMLNGMSEKLTEPEGEGSKIFHTTFVSNAEKMVELIDHMNLTGCEGLEKARKQLDDAIRGVDIDDIRKDEEVRADIKRQVDDAIKGFGEW